MKKFLNFTKVLTVILFIPYNALCDIKDDVIQALISYNILEDIDHDDINIIWEKDSENFVRKFSNAKDIKLIENDKSKTSFTISAKFTNDKISYINKNITGFYTQYIYIPVLKVNFFSGDIIEEDDLDIARINLSKITKSTYKNKSNIIGKAARKSIRAHKAINFSDLSEPNIVNKGDKINIKYYKNNLSISMRAIALNNGAKGDIIKLKNTRSNNILSAIIKDKNTAELIE